MMRLPPARVGWRTAPRPRTRSAPWPWARSGPSIVPRPGGLPRRPFLADHLARGGGGASPGPDDCAISSRTGDIASPAGAGDSAILRSPAHATPSSPTSATRRSGIVTTATAKERGTDMNATATATTATGAAAARSGSSAAPPADVFVVFGITGDLAKVMTFRSLYRLEKRGLLNCPVIGVAGDDWTLEHLREHARE